MNDARFTPKSIPLALSIMQWAATADRQRPPPLAGGCPTGTHIHASLELASSRRLDSRTAFVWYDRSIIAAATPPSAAATKARRSSRSPSLPELNRAHSTPLADYQFARLVLITAEWTLLTMSRGKAFFSCCYCRCVPVDCHLLAAAQGLTSCCENGSSQCLPSTAILSGCRVTSCSWPLW